eukprot:10642694-Karenia_brevis.AAC.1
MKPFAWQRQQVRLSTDAFMTATCTWLDAECQNHLVPSTSAWARRSWQPQMCGLRRGGAGDSSRGRPR